MPKIGKRLAEQKPCLVSVWVGNPFLSMGVKFGRGVGFIELWLASLFSWMSRTVRNDFGRQDDHIVPGTEGDDCTVSGGNQGTNKVDMSAALGWSGAASEAVDGSKQALILSRIEDAGVPRLRLPAGRVSPASPVELTAGVTGGVTGSIHPGPRQSVCSSGQVYDDVDPAVVSNSCHPPLNDVGPADGDGQLFEGEEEDCNPRGIGCSHKRPRQRYASLRFVHSIVETSVMAIPWNATSRH